MSVLHNYRQHHVVDRLVAIGLLAGGLVLAAAAPAFGIATISLSQSTGLKQAQVVTVTGSGLVASAFGYVIECNDAPGEPTVRVGPPFDVVLPIGLQCAESQTHRAHDGRRDAVGHDQGPREQVPRTTVRPAPGPRGVRASRQCGQGADGRCSRTIPARPRRRSRLRVHLFGCLRGQYGAEGVDEYQLRGRRRAGTRPAGHRFPSTTPTTPTTTPSTTPAVTTSATQPPVQPGTSPASGTPSGAARPASGGSRAVTTPGTVRANSGSLAFTGLGKPGVLLAVFGFALVLIGLSLFFLDVRKLALWLLGL